MITIDVSDNERDLRLFGVPSSDLSHWLKASVWSLEEAAAISIGFEPDALSLGVILRKCPEEIRDRPLGRQPEVLFRLSSVAQFFFGRLSLLERAIIAGELPSIKSDGSYWLKPFDFLRWFEDQTAEDWNYIPLGMTAMLEALAGSDTEKKKADRSSLGAPKRRKGRKSALNHLIFHMRKSPNCPPHEKRTALRQEIKDQFDIGKNIADDVIREAQELTKVDWYKRGRPSKRK